ncbi:hypothetical protein L195_g064333 [Trifolium pratense]|uniref:Uncharacterized protein n=1 Tax=Trifolium pratense TaxID=57577 RepID=A0A2K3KSG1_TRIPR|nr:hypothetical protein L195_g064333 [Trifolium pratense]
MSHNCANVVRTGPDRPVRSRTEHNSGPGGCQEPAVCKTGKKPFGTGSNHPEPFKPLNRGRF